MAMLHERDGGWLIGSRRKPRTRHRIASTRGRAGGPVAGIASYPWSEYRSPVWACPVPRTPVGPMWSVAGQQQGPHGQSGPHSQFVMALTSFLETQVRVGLAGGEGHFEGGEVAIEFGQFDLAPGHGRSLRR